MKYSIALGLPLALAGCNLSATGMLLEDDLASGTSSGSTGSGSSSSSSSGPDSPSTTDVDAESSSSSEGPITSSDVNEPAQLVFRLDAPQVQFGDIDHGDSSTRVLLLDNLGGSTATSLAAAPIEGDFSFPGGFPGNKGDCKDTLDPGQECRVEIHFSPTRIGAAQAELTVEYYDGVDLSAPTPTDTLFLQGGGIGSSENLLVNGDAETGNLDAWTPGLSNVWAVSPNAAQGDYAFHSSGGALGTTTTLAQTVPLSPSQFSTTQPGLRFEARGRAHKTTGLTYDVRVRFDGASEVSVASGEHTEYTTFEHADPVALDATNVTLEVSCTNQNPGPCDGFFDELELRVVYP